MKRRAFLSVLVAAPAIVRAESLMPLWVPRDTTRYLLVPEQEGIQIYESKFDTVTLDEAKFLRDINRYWREAAVKVTDGLMRS